MEENHNGADTLTHLMKFTYHQAGILFTKQLSFIEIQCTKASLKKHHGYERRDFHSRSMNPKWTVGDMGWKWQKKSRERAFTTKSFQFPIITKAWNIRPMLKKGMEENHTYADTWTHLIHIPPSRYFAHQIFFLHRNAVSLEKHHGNEGRDFQCRGMNPK